MIKKLPLVAVICGLLVIQFPNAYAQGSDCEAKAVDKNGKPLKGAAKNSFMKKCTGGVQASCEAKAMDKNDKPLKGAAKNSFMKKCEAEAAAK